MTAWLACTPVDDLANGTRYFQQAPCPAGYVHAPLPPEPVPMLRVAPEPASPGGWPATPGSVVYRWHWHDRGFAGNPARSQNFRGHR